MKKYIKPALFLAGGIFLVLAWVMFFHNAWVAAELPKWAWLQTTITNLGQHVEEPPPEDEDPDNTKNEIPVHVARITTGTVHRYLDSYGVVTPRAAEQDQMSGSANIAAAVAGVVSKVVCQINHKVRAGDPLVELDNRLAKAAEEQAGAALAESEAALALLKAPPPALQREIARLAVEKSRASVDFAQKNYDRQKQLAADQGVAGKVLEQAANDLGSAKNDLAAAEKNVALLEAGPRPEEVQQAQAKVQQAKAALSAASIQTQLLTLRSPIDATVVTIAANVGETVDTNRALVSLIAFDRLMVDVDVPADQLPDHAEGLTVEITNDSAGGKDNQPVVGNIGYVNGQVASKNGAVMVAVYLPATSTFRPGLTVRTRMVLSEHKDVLLVPRQAVVTDENGDFVISIVTGEQAIHRNITIGLEENGMIEIISDGLKEGMSVVSEGAFGLRETQATHIKIVE